MTDTPHLIYPSQAAKVRFTIRSTETDPADKLAPAVLFSMLQEASSYSAASLGLPAEVMDSRNLCWMLSKISVEMEAWPNSGETIEVVTWPRGISSLFYQRDYLIFSEEGAQLGSGTSDWFLADVDTRRPQRPSLFADMNNAFSSVTQRATDGDALKIREKIKAESSSSLRYRTRWSDLDRNGHVNNTHYVTWGYNALRESGIVNNPPAAIHMNYLRELTDIQFVDVFWEQASAPEGIDTDNKTFLIEGRTDEGLCYRCIMSFS